jgi:catechol 2,3-dioxygenase
MSIDPSAGIGAVHLTTANLDRAVAFYEKSVGLAAAARDEQTAALGARGAPFLVLHERRSAVRVAGTTGLYHFAILVPTRGDLVDALRRLVAAGTPLQGAADHGVSEALYLADPDGNGIEIYCDRPRSEWPFERGGLRMVTEPLDLDDLMAAGDDRPPAAEEGRSSVWRASGTITASGVGTDAGHPGMAPGTTVGHVHLHVAHLSDTREFYGQALGFVLTQQFGRSALFFAAGTYHHHIGANTWAGEGAPPPPAGALGLDFYEITLPTRHALSSALGAASRAGVRAEMRPEGALVVDPSGNRVLLTAGAGS